MSIRLLLVVLILSACFSSFALAAPGRINYQGTLTDSSGVPVTDSVSITFRIFDENIDGTELWNEVQTVDVEIGTYRVLLGADPFPADLFDADNRWLEIEIGGEALMPRQQLTSVPYALQAEVAEIARSVADGAVTSSQLASSVVTLDKINCSTDQVLKWSGTAWECVSPMVLQQSCFDGDIVDCYSGSISELGNGDCRRGVRTCDQGSFSSICVGEVVGSSPECSLAELDKDCDGHEDCYQLLWMNGWTVPEYLTNPISVGNTSASRHKVAIDNNGNAIVVWEQFDGTTAQIFKSEYRGGSWTHPASLSDKISVGGTFAYAPQVAMDDNGNAIIVWQQYVGINQQIFKSEYRFDGNSWNWTHPTSLADNINVAGEGDQEHAVVPQVAMDNNGNAIIIWQQWDGGYAKIFKSEYRFDGSSWNWTHPTTLADNINVAGQSAYVPQVAMDNNGKAIIVWQQSDGTNVQIFKSEYHSGDWTHPASLTDNISIDGTSANSPLVVMDNNDNAIIVWQQTDGFKNLIYKSEFRSGSWVHPISLGDTPTYSTIGDVDEYDVVMDDSGSAIIVYRQHDGTRYHIYKNEYDHSSGQWIGPTGWEDHIDDDSLPGNFAQISMDGSGNSLIVWLQSDGEKLQIFKSQSLSGSWTKPVSLADNISLGGTDAGAPQVAMNKNGVAVVVWNQSDGANSQIYMAEFRSDFDGDGFALTDCRKFDPSIHPQTEEITCDGIDQNCNGMSDDDPPDYDGDGFTTCQGDCNNLLEDTYPGALEVCDGMDNDCDELIDEELVAPLLLKQDGVCSGWHQICDIGGGWNDYYWDVPNYEYSEYSCDGLDNDCDGSVDEGCEDADGDGSIAMYDCDDADPNNWSSCASCLDGDSDTYFANCDAYVTISGPDCDDTNIDAFPGQVWYPDCDGDNFFDANGISSCFPVIYADCVDALPPDGGWSHIDPATNADCDDENEEAFPGQVWYADCDSDAFFDANGISSCSTPASSCVDTLPPDGGWDHIDPGNIADCDDENAEMNPGQAWFADCDGDGFFDASFVYSCLAPTSNCVDTLPPDGGWAHTDPAVDADCDDESGASYPGNAEICDGIDNDCINGIDDNLSAPLCSKQVGVCSGATSPSCFGEVCTDTEYTANNPLYEPDETSCDGYDNDCDGEVDEGCGCPGSYTDMYEPNETDATAYYLGTLNDNSGAIQFTAAFPSSADVDFYRYFGMDYSASNENPILSITNNSSDVDGCIYASCNEGDSIFDSCSNGYSSTMNGMPGCCSTNPVNMELQFYCSGGSYNDADVYIRVQSQTDGCNEYDLETSF